MPLRDWIQWQARQAITLFMLAGSFACENLARGAITVHQGQLNMPATGRAGFREMPPASTGLELPVSSRQRTSPNSLFVANPGAAAGDYDGDGRCDVFICNLEGRSALFRNLGHWQFTNSNAAAGLDLDGRAIYGATFADLNGDGHLDLLALSLTETNSLYLGDGHGRFTEDRQFPWRHTIVGGDITATLADIDGDGDLDLYMTSYSQRRYMDVMDPAVLGRLIEDQKARMRRGEPPDADFEKVFEIHPFSREGVLDYHLEERSIPDVLYLNEGAGIFQPIVESTNRFLEADGAACLLRDWGLGAAFRDVNGDGAPDLYVCNDYLSADRFWLNDGTGRFIAANREALRHTSRFSMGVDLGDLNRDGHVDLITLDMLSRSHTRRIVESGSVSPPPIVWGQPFQRPQYLQNSLHLGRGDGTFAEISRYAGLQASDWSWCVLCLDVDLDGFEDVIITTGMERDFLDADVAARIRRWRT